jgi:hypothetical protein
MKTNTNSNRFTKANHLGKLAMVLALLAAHLLFNGCTAEEMVGEAFEDIEEIDSTWNTDQGYVSAQVDGRHWTSQLGASFAVRDGAMILTGIALPSGVFVMVGRSSVEGVYSMDSTKHFAIGFGTDGKNYASRKGTIRITAIDKNWAEGTFDAELVAEKDVTPKVITMTNGKFKAKYSNDSQAVP